jgi:hypothetical protein
VTIREAEARVKRKRRWGEETLFDERPIPRVVPS